MKAIIQQESSGGTDPSAGGDIMQASEGAGRNITDPQDSVNAGTSEFARDYKMSNGNLEWALAAYNMGTGILGWSETRGITDPRQAMSAFSSYMKQLNGTSVYGDPHYIDHVMRYIQ